MKEGENLITLLSLKNSERSQSRLTSVLYLEEEVKEKTTYASTEHQRRRLLRSACSSSWLLANGDGEQAELLTSRQCFNSVLCAVRI
eukprot:scaffold23709_cov86-Skeletonema_dohrnii-CCMP3373.AAC.2